MPEALNQLRVLLDLQSFQLFLEARPEFGDAGMENDSVAPENHVFPKFCAC